MEKIVDCSALQLTAASRCSTPTRGKSTPLTEPPMSPIPIYRKLGSPGRRMSLVQLTHLPQLPIDVSVRHHQIIHGLKRTDGVILTWYKAAIHTLDHQYMHMKTPPSSADATAYINARKAIILKTVATMQLAITARKNNSLLTPWFVYQSNHVLLNIVDIYFLLEKIKDWNQFWVCLTLFELHLCC